MIRRAVRPLDSGAVAAADSDIYQRHADDPRPNALYDADGNRTPLDPDDPAQAELRREWMDLYEAHGGAVEGGTSNPRQPDDPGEPCCNEVADLHVQVVNDCDGSPIEGAQVEISGPESRSGATNAEGWAGFEGIEPGAYNVSAGHDGYNDGDTEVTVPPATSQTAEVELTPTIRIEACEASYTVVLDSNGNAPTAYPILEFEITDGPPNYRYDLQVTRGASSALSGGPGLADAWCGSDDRDDRADKTEFSTWSNGEQTLRLDGSGAATYSMPLEWWRDLARIPLDSFDELDVRFRVLAMPDGTDEPCAYSTTDADHAAAGHVTVRNNLERARVVDLGYVDGGHKKSVRMEFTVREPNTTEMYTIVQWMQGASRLWCGTPPVLRYPPHQLYDIRHDCNFPDWTIDRLHTNPRYWDGTYTISSDGLTASATDRPGSSSFPTGCSHKFYGIDFETRFHLNFEVPAAVTVVRQDGSPPVYGVVTGELADPQPVTLASDTWDAHILLERTASGVTVTHPASFGGP